MRARLAVPMHFEMFEFNTASPDAFAAECERLGQPYRVLRAGERLGAPVIADNRRDAARAAPHRAAIDRAAPVRRGAASQPDQVRAEAIVSGISHGTELALYRGVSPFDGKRFDPDLRLFVEDAEIGDVPDAARLRVGRDGERARRGRSAHREVGDLVHLALPHRETQTLAVDDDRTPLTPAAERSRSRARRAALVGDDRAAGDPRRADQGRRHGRGLRARRLRPARGAARASERRRVDRGRRSDRGPPRACTPARRRPRARSVGRRRRTRDQARRRARRRRRRDRVLGTLLGSARRRCAARASPEPSWRRASTPAAPATSCGSARSGTTTG